MFKTAQTCNLIWDMVYALSVKPRDRLASIIFWL